MKGGLFRLFFVAAMAVCGQIQAEWPNGQNYIFATPPQPQPQPQFEYFENILKINLNKYKCRGTQDGYS